MRPVLELPNKEVLPLRRNPGHLASASSARGFLFLFPLGDNPTDHFLVTAETDHSCVLKPTAGHAIMTDQEELTYLITMCLFTEERQ